MKTKFVPAFNGLFVLREFKNDQWQTRKAYKHKEIRGAVAKGEINREKLLDCAGIFNNCPASAFEALTDSQIIDMLED
jgi:hypothetical protein